MTTTVGVGPGGTRAEWSVGPSNPKTQVITDAISNNWCSAIACSSNGQVAVFVQYLTAAAPKCYLSTDGGYTWTATAANPSTSCISSAVGNSYFGVFVQDANTFSVAYCTTTLAVFSKTTNGGTSWTTNTGSLAATSAASGTSARCTDASTAFYVTTASTTSIKWAKTSNSGSSFTSGTVATETIVGAGTPSIATTDSATVYAFWSNTGTTWRWSKSTDSGSTWAAAANLVTDHFGASLNQNSLATSTTTVYYSYRTNATGSPLKVLVSTNGTSFSTAFDGSTRPIFRQDTSNTAVTPMGAAPDGTVYLVDFNSATSLASEVANLGLLYTSDNGTTWTQRYTRNLLFDFLSTGDGPEGPIGYNLACPTNHSLLFLHGAQNRVTSVYEYRRHFNAPG